MKTKDVVIGNMYMTRIGNALCRVIVVAKKEGEPGRPGHFGRIRKRVDEFVVRRPDSKTPLPSTRTAAALREIEEKPKPESESVTPDLPGTKEQRDAFIDQFQKEWDRVLG